MLLPSCEGGEGGWRGEDKDGDDGTGAQQKRKGRDRWGRVDSARRKQVRQGPRSQLFH